MILVSASLFHVYILTVFRHLISRVSINVKALIGAFNYEKTQINRGLLHVWEIFANLRLKRLYDADTINEDCQLLLALESP